MVNKLTVVMYHYVRDLKNSLFPDIKGLDISSFIEQIEYLKRNYNIISMEEVINSIDNDEDLPKKSVLLTFDDGYIDHYVNVFPILDQYKLQGSFYIPAKPILENVVLDVNKLHFVLASVNDINEIVLSVKGFIDKYKSEYDLYEFDYYLKNNSHTSRFDAKEIVFVKRLLQFVLPEKLRAKILDELFIKYIGVSEDVFSRDLYMNQEQLKTMLSTGMHIGSHGYNHYWWNQLSVKDQEREIRLSMDFLSAIGVDMGQWTACYPYGAYDSQSINILNEKGCKLSFTTEVSVATITRDNRFLIPRLDTNDLPKKRSANTDDWYLEH